MSAVVLMLTGVTLGQQAGEQKKGSSMTESMPDMMKGKQAGEGGMHGMHGMHGMGDIMRRMKMMEQCSDMMKSMHHQADKAQETQTK